MVSWSPVITTLVIGCVQTVIFYIFFEKFRSSPTKQHIFDARKQTKAHRTPRAPGPGFLAWNKEASLIDDETLLKYVGMDTYVFLRFLRFCFQFTAIGSVLSLCILVPTYYYGENDEADTSGYNTITLANVRPGDDRLFAPLAVFYLFVAAILKLLWAEWEHFIPRRYRFLANGDVDTPTVFKYSVLVENIPLQYRSSKRLFAHFDHLFPGQVVAANVCLNTRALDKLIAERQKHIVAKENAVAKTTAKPDKKPQTVKVGAKLKCIGGHKEEAIPYHTTEIERLNELIDAEYKRVMDFVEKLNSTDLDTINLWNAGKSSLSRSLNKISSKVISPRAKEELPQSDIAEDFVAFASSSGFVEFNTLTAKQSALQMELTGRTDYLEPLVPPIPSDVLWQNITVPKPKQEKGLFLSSLLWTFGVLFWAIPVSAVQFISNIDTIEEELDVSIAEAGSVEYGLLSGYLPVIAFIVLMTVLPILIELSAKKVAKLKGNSAVDNFTFQWHFKFQIANLWLVLIGGSFFDQLGTFTSKPQKIPELIAVAVPGQSQFFLNLLITQCFAGMFMELSRLVPLILDIVLSKIAPPAGKSQRTLDTGLTPPFLKWGIIYPQLILQMLVAMVYVCIVPVIMPFAALYFAIGLAVYRHQALHVYAQHAEGGGLNFLALFRMIMFCLYTAELVFVAFIGLKEGAIQAPLAIIPVLATVYFHSRVNTHFTSHCTSLALTVAREEDDKNATETRSPNPMPDEASGIVAWLDTQEYAQPNLRSGKWETDARAYRRYLEEKGAGEHVVEGTSEQV